MVTSSPATTTGSSGFIISHRSWGKDALQEQFMGWTRLVLEVSEEGEDAVTFPFFTLCVMDVGPRPGRSITSVALPPPVLGLHSTVLFLVLTTPLELYWRV